MPTTSIQPTVLKRFSFTYFVNVQEDLDGRRAGYDKGFREGDALQIAYRGFTVTDPFQEGRERLESVAHHLYARFNSQDLRPVGYRGPSMSIGSVIEIQGVHFAVEPLDFKEVEIWKSPIAETDSRWHVGLPASGNVLVMEPIR